MSKDDFAPFYSLETEKIKTRRDKFLRQLGCEKIGLPLSLKAQKKFCNFIRDYNIVSIAHIDYKYKTFRYLSDVKDEDLSLLLFDGLSTWYGFTDNENKLYFVSQPSKSPNFYHVDDVLSLLTQKKDFLAFCKENGHNITLNFDNQYNWRSDDTFMFLMELKIEREPKDYVDIHIIDWGVENDYRYQ